MRHLYLVSYIGLLPNGSGQYYGNCEVKLDSRWNEETRGSLLGELTNLGEKDDAFKEPVITSIFYVGEIEDCEESTTSLDK